MMASVQSPPERQIEDFTQLFRDFQGIDCTACAHHFGFQYRFEKNIRFCSPHCLSNGKQVIEQIKCAGGIVSQSQVEGLLQAAASPGVSPCGTLAHKHVYSPSPLAGTPRSDRSFVPVLQPVPSNFHNGRLEKENDAGRQPVKEQVLGVLRGSSGSSRGGRGGGNYSLPRGYRQQRNPQDSPFFQTRRDIGEDLVDRSGGAPLPSSSSSSKGLTEQAVNDAFAKNAAKSKEDDFATVEQEKRMAFVALARKPQSTPEEVQEQEQKAVTLPRVIKQLKPTAVDNPCPVPIKPVPVPTKNEKNEQPPMSTTTAAPIQVGLKKPGSSVGGSSPSPVKPQPTKKCWTIKDLSWSLSLVNLAPCSVLFQWSIDKYHVSAIDDESKLSALQDALAEYCLKAPAITRTPSINDIIFAPYDGEYYRGKVTGIDQAGGLVKVMFIDYGDEKEVTLKDCREPQDDLMKYPIYGVEFFLKLDKEVPESMRKAPIPVEIAEAALKEVSMTIDEQHDDHFTGILHVGTYSFNSMVNKLFKIASPAAAPALKPVVAPTIPTLKPVQPVAAIPEVKPTVIATPEVVSKPSTSRAPFPMVIKTKTPAPKWTIRSVTFSDKLNTGSAVQITFLWDMSKLTVSATDDQLNLEYLQNEINKFIPNAPAMTRTPQLDEIVIASYDGVYYRGRVSGIDGENITVVFVDYGDKVTVKLGDLKEPSEEIMKHPIYGACVRMPGVPVDYSVINSPKIESASEGGGQIEIISQDDPTLWIAQLWIEEKENWSDLANAAIKAQGN